MGYVVMRIDRTNADSVKAPGSVLRDCRARSALAVVVVRRKRHENHSNRASDLSPSDRSVVFPSRPRSATRLAHLVPTTSVASNPHSPRPALPAV